MTELDLFGLTTWAMMKAGSEFSALIPIFNALPVHDGQPLPISHSMAGRNKIEAGQLLCADLCGVYDRYHGNVMRGIYVGEPPTKLVRQYERAPKIFDLFSDNVKSGMTVRAVNKLIHACLADNGLDKEEGWVVGYEIGLSLPPDWVGDFYFNSKDTDYLDRVFEENSITNLESLFNTCLIDALVYTPDGCRIQSITPRKLLVSK